MHWKRTNRLRCALALIGAIATASGWAQLPTGKAPPPPKGQPQVQSKGVPQQPGNQGQPQTSVGWQWNTKYITAAPMTIYGTGELGLADALKKWDTRKVTATAFTIYGTGELGLADSLKKWDTKKVTAPAFTIYGTGSLLP